MRLRQQFHGVSGHTDPFAFVAGALDRADALRDDPAALVAAWPASGVIALDADGRALADAQRQLLTWSGATWGGDVRSHTLLGLREGRAWFLANGDAVPVEAPQHVDLRSAAAEWPAWQATLFAQARALQHWHREYRYCAACGGALTYRRAGWLAHCDHCGREHYPRTDQAIIAAITDGQRLLLGRQASWARGRWSLIAGFVEPGETLEQTVAREVMEETGIRVDVGSARYLASQPWPFPSSLMLGFIAHAAPETPVVGEELEAADWFSAEQVRAGLAVDWQHPGDAEFTLSAPLSIARYVIAAWLREHDAAGGNSR